jgi:lipoyl(octanoyl) transferase
MPRLDVVHLGLRSYGEILELQRAVARARIARDVEHDVLLLVEHHPVVTLGRTAKAANLVATPELLAARGVERFEVERGGDVTFHGPGQLVGYPIIDLTGHKKDLHWYLRQLEAALIRALGAWHIPAERNQGLTGVWTRGRKIASIGVHAREWVTWHGFALNVSVDLSYFDLMVPCGISGVVMTSMERETAQRIPLADVSTAVAHSLGEAFGLEIHDLPEEVLTDKASTPPDTTGLAPLSGVIRRAPETNPALR